MTKLTKYMVYICCFLMLIGGIAFYFHYRNAMPLESVKIYKTTTPMPIRKNPETKQPSSEIVQGGHWHGNEWHAEPHGEQSSVRQEVPRRKEPVTATSVTKTALSTPEISGTEVAFGKEVWIEKQFDQLDEWFSQNYPDVVEATQMTKEEYFKVYDTPEAARAMRERVNLAKSETFEQLSMLFSEMPTSMAEDIFDTARQHLISRWDVETVDKAISRLRMEMGL